MPLIYILVSVIIISLISFIGVLALVFKKKKIKELIVTLIAFSAGALLATAFFDLIPKTIELAGDQGFSLILIGIIVFFLLERVIHWHHCGTEECDFHAEGYLNLIADGFHNFLDGVVIAIAYIADIRLGIITTFAVAVHEIPQELGDFFILIHGKFSEKKALFFNFISALTSILGALLTFFLVSSIQSLVPLLLALASGSFIYIATTDLLPVISKETNRKKMMLHTLAFFIGIIVIYISLNLIPEI